MNLAKLFETQAALDEHIMQEHPELVGQNNLDWKILALQVELGECANEWRGFKKWSTDQEPRTVRKIETEWDDDGNATEWLCNENINPLLEEYVDCLHFILSIGLELKIDLTEEWPSWIQMPLGTLKHFSLVFSLIANLDEYNSMLHERWRELFEEFYWLGESLGFSWEQIKSAYFTKNQINHERQESGY